MKQNQCPNCGSTDFINRDGYKICQYCQSKFKINNSVIALQEDIDNLLEKCEREPWNAKKYANLILDIDPKNSKAVKYLL